MVTCLRALEKQNTLSDLIVTTQVQPAQYTALTGTVYLTCILTLIAQHSGGKISMHCINMRVCIYPQIATVVT